jgi:hypothetical protein
MCNTTANIILFVVYKGTERGTGLSDVFVGHYLEPLMPHLPHRLPTNHEKPNKLSYDDCETHFITSTLHLPSQVLPSQAVNCTAAWVASSSASGVEEAPENYEMDALGTPSPVLRQDGDVEMNGNKVGRGEVWIWLFRLYSCWT